MREIITYKINASYNLVTFGMIFLRKQIRMVVIDSTIQYGYLNTFPAGPRLNGACITCPSNSPRPASPLWS